MTTLSFDNDRAVDRHYFQRTEEENLKAAAADEALAQRFRKNDGKGLLQFCKEVAGSLIQRYLVSNDPKQVRFTVSRDLQKLTGCSGKQASYLIDLALELIHLKVHGEYCRNEIELSLLISKASGLVEDLQMN